MLLLFSPPVQAFEHGMSQSGTEGVEVVEGRLLACGQGEGDANTEHVIILGYHACRRKRDRSLYTFGYIPRTGSSIVNLSGTLPLGRHQECA